MSTCRTCIAIDCDPGNRYKYSLQAETFPYVLYCPTGENCNPGGDYFLTFFACTGASIVRYIPPAVTTDQFKAILNEMMTEMSSLLQYCKPEGYDPSEPWTLYYNSPQCCTSLCPDGNAFTYCVGAGKVMSFTKEAADQIAYQQACALAKTHRICLGTLQESLCASTAYSIKLKASGAIGKAPKTNYWSVSGTLPTGMTLTTGPRTKPYALLAGTPTTGGLYTFTVTIVAPDGDYMSKSYSVFVVQMSPANLADATVGTYYTQTMTVVSLPALWDAEWEVTSGTLPDGLTLTVDGVLSGTPTTVESETFTIGVNVTSA